MLHTHDTVAGLDLAEYGITDRSDTARGIAVDNELPGASGFDRMDQPETDTNAC